MLKMTAIHLLASLGSGQQVMEGRSKLDCWNCCNLVRNVQMLFSKTMKVVVIRLRLEGSPQKVIAHSQVKIPGSEIRLTSANNSVRSDYVNGIYWLHVTALAEWSLSRIRGQSVMSLSPETTEDLPCE
ncbi:hypothetical protein TNCV_4646801 [Trichonephila clavipes]|uniref:Uncharacterized protein n=1 Tax=Trichonephila clavipes TaxID=2585209 RepID=A0A8X6VI37_TRICX|nr:hypothetical protein TNCV_4646801 [Trichonephila clavipes]